MTDRVPVAIVGAGMVGRAWSTVLARGGHEVRLFDEDPDSALRAMDDIDSMLALFESAGLLSSDERAAAASRVHPTASLREALADVGYVQECVPEIVELKQAVTCAIAEIAPADAVLASSTSGLVPSSFTATAVGRERCVVAHPINPVHLHTLVEIVPAPWTSTDTVDRAVALLRDAGLEPVRLTREIDGFLVNRIQSAVLHEAFRLISEGVATASDIDTAVRSGLAPRWSFMGPFETIDLNAPNGIADYVERYEPMYQRLAAAQVDTVDWSATLDASLLDERQAALPREELAARRSWRDAQLLALLQHRSRSEGGSE